MKLLFITRKYPPMVGGMEKLSFALAKEFSKKVDTTLITWGKSQKYLPYFLPLALAKSIYYIPTKKIDHIHLGDALLSPLGVLLKTIFGLKTTVTACGLDITFNFKPYQIVVPWCLKRLDKIICISNTTLEECVKRGIPRDKCVVVPCGVYPEEFKVSATLEDLEKIANLNLHNKKVLITVGRLVKRKGVYWFIKNVLPKLKSNIIYLVIGIGPEYQRIQKLIRDLKIKDKVLLLGKVSDKRLKIIYNTADMFVMPNIKIKGDVEGFGIVALEASSAGLPIIASKLEGIRDAVIDGKTGYLVEDSNSSEFIQRINSNNFKKSNISRIIKENYSWNKIVNRYVDYIK